MADDVKRIGVMVGREWSWPPAFIEEVNQRKAGVVAEFLVIGGTRMNEANPYAVIVDRISHEIPYYRTYLKNAVLHGTIVVNNPFWWSADDKFFGACLLDKLGIKHAKTIALPSHSYVDGVVTESLRNLTYPDSVGAAHRVFGRLPVDPQAGVGRRLQAGLQSPQPARIVGCLQRNRHRVHDAAAVHRLGELRAVHRDRAAGCPADQV